VFYRKAVEKVPYTPNLPERSLFFFFSLSRFAELLCEQMLRHFGFDFRDRN
jgi:hypothetical protein